eukprot:200915-Chlamydomonas_euryale.AAC.1
MSDVHGQSHTGELLAVVEAAAAAPGATERELCAAVAVVQVWGAGLGCRPAAGWGGDGQDGWLKGRA